MQKYKYTPELLAEAAANSLSIAGVLRHLGNPISGGAHAHISRRLKHFGAKLMAVASTRSGAFSRKRSSW